MHQFQPFSIETIDLNPFVQIGKNHGILCSGTKKESNLMTIGWGGMGPVFGINCISVFVRDSRYTKEFIDNNMFFSVSQLKDGYASALEFCGEVSGRNRDKWLESGLTKAFRHGIPYPDEAQLVLLCQIAAAIPITEQHILDKRIIPKWYEKGDYHTMYIGEIMEVMAR